MTDEQFLNIYGFPRNPPPPAPPFGAAVEPYNGQQLASYAQARKLRDAINTTLINFGDGSTRPMGGGVLPGDDEPVAGQTPDPSAIVGIFLPSWAAGPGGFTEPGTTGSDGTKYLFLHLRFKDGITGMNVGLILDKFSRYPMSPGYVIMQIAAEAEGALR